MCFFMYVDLDHSVWVCTYVVYNMGSSTTFYNSLKLINNKQESLVSTSTHWDDPNISLLNTLLLY